MKHLINILVAIVTVIIIAGCSSLGTSGGNQSSRQTQRADVVEASDACARGTLAGYEVESNYYLEGESEQRKEQVTCK